jgi:hypothetical protein
MVLAAKRDGPDGTFHGVVVEFDAALGRLASDSRLDGIELGDASERLGRDGRARRLMHLIELASCMGPTRRKLDLLAPSALHDLGASEAKCSLKLALIPCSVLGDSLFRYAELGQETP